MINKAILVGNIGKEPELKKIGETNYCAFTLATNKSYKDRNGEWQTKTEWHNIVVWRNQAEYATNNFKKGNTVYVEGEITSRSWEDNQGNKRYTTEIVAEKVKLMEKKTRQEVEEDSSDDLPFN